MWWWLVLDYPHESFDNHRSQRVTLRWTMSPQLLHFEVCNNFQIHGIFKWLCSPWILFLSKNRKTKKKTKKTLVFLFLNNANSLILISYRCLNLRSGRYCSTVTRFNDVPKWGALSLALLNEVGTTKAPRTPKWGVNLNQIPKCRSRCQEVGWRGRKPLSQIDIPK